MEDHQGRVTQIAARIAAFHQSSTPFRVYHGNTNSTRPSSRTLANSIDISDLNHIISVNGDTKTCLVEPSVPMDVLVATTLKHGMVPPVVPEFPGITVGGAFAGTAGESSSFRHGFFDDCVNWAEIVLADGEIVTASNEEQRELFHGSKGTFGTISLGTLFEVRLIEAGKYVKVEYHVIARGVAEASEIMRQQCVRSATEVQFIDGIMFSRDEGVVITGRMVADDSSDREGNDLNKLPIATFSRPSDPWFYLHVKHIMNHSSDEKGEVYQELIPLEDYLFRYDRGAFWTGRYAFKYFLTPFNKVTRWLLDGFMHTRVMYHALHRSGLMQKFIIQDMAVSWDNINPFFTWLDEALGIYPLWLAPLKLGNGGVHFNSKFIEPTSSAKQNDGLMLNVGVWGFPPMEPLSANRAIEQKLTELKGMKWLYSQTFYTEDEFWSIYDRKWYEQLRTRYKAQTLPDIYDKVGGTALNQQNTLTGIWNVWPLAGIYGVLSTLKGGDYLRKR